LIELLMKSLVLLMMLLVALPNFELARGSPDEGKGNPFDDHPEAIEAGQKLFSQMCSGCHGAKAEGGRGPNLENGELIHNKGEDKLFLSIHNGVPGTEMLPFNVPDNQIWQMLAFIHNLSAPAAESRAPGDPEDGKAIYLGKGHCANCHMILGHGGFIGPDLSNIGMSHSWKQLQQALRDPKTRSREGYEGATIATKAGARISGVIKDHTNYSLALLDASGNLHLLPMQEIREITLRKDSLMPDDYDRALTPKEIENLLAFLSRQSVRPIKLQASSAGRPKG
jgi:cytochrome c oxidase cbb3-type subunit 3